jgi:hypothetical protein
MALASPHRWREIEEFFPEDSEAVLAKEREVRALPQQDECIVLCGSCGMRPDEIVIDRERYVDKTLNRFDRTRAHLNGMGLTKEAVELLAAVALREASEREASDKRRVATLAAVREANRKMPVMSELVPLTGKLVAPGPDYTEAAAKQKRLETRERLKAERKEMFKRLGEELNASVPALDGPGAVREHQMRPREEQQSQAYHCFSCGKYMRGAKHTYCCDECFDKGS